MIAYGHVVVMHGLGFRALPSSCSYFNRDASSHQSIHSDDHFELLDTSLPNYQIHSRLPKTGLSDHRKSLSAYAFLDVRPMTIDLDHHSDRCHSAQRPKI